MLKVEIFGRGGLSVAQKTLVVCLVLLIASSVFGGPLGVISRGERHFLLLLIVGSALTQIRAEWDRDLRALLKKNWVILLPVLFFIANLIWVFPFAISNNEGFLYALMDMQSLLMLPVATLVFLAMWKHVEGFQKIMRLTIVMCTLLALVQAALWLVLRIYHFPHEVIYEYVELYFGTRESIAILEQPSNQGSYFRVVWISSYWLIFGVFLSPLFIGNRYLLFFIQAIFGLAIISSYTRGIWLGLTVGILILVLLIKSLSKLTDVSQWRVSLLGLTFALVSVVFVEWMDGNSGLILSRFYIENSIAEKIIDKPIENTKVNDESSMERKVQTYKLLHKWQERPWFGHGYGSYVKDHYSHESRPFLYEMVPVALLMKLGVFGFLIYLSFFIFILYRLWCMRSCFQSAIILFSCITAYLIQVHTNPVFFSFTGALIFTILMYYWMTLEMAISFRPGCVYEK